MLGKVQEFFEHLFGFDTANSDLRFGIFVLLILILLGISVHKITGYIFYFLK